MTGVLGVPTVEYLPFAFFNIINPILAIVFGFTGYHVEHQKPAEPQGQEPAGSPGDSGQEGSGPDAAARGDRS